jgi:hypothetical protein
MRRIDKHELTEIALVDPADIRRGRTEIAFVHPADVRRNREVIEPFEFAQPTHDSIRYIESAAAEDHRVESSPVADRQASRAGVGRVMRPSERSDHWLTCAWHAPPAPERRA